MKVVVIDGQGGGIGRTIVERLNESTNMIEIIALGTNSNATMGMLKAGAHKGATGENAILVNAPKADIIIGPMAILVADSMMGEITKEMSAAVGRSEALKYLIPVNRCGLYIAGLPDIKLNEWINHAVDEILLKCQEG